MRNCCKTFTESITTFANGPAFACDMEKHSTVAIKAVPVQERDSVSGPVQPFGPFLDCVKQGQHHPGHSPLNPDGFVSIDQSPIAVESTEKSAVFDIHAAREPKTNCVVKKPVTISREQFRATIIGH